MQLIDQQFRFKLIPILLLVLVFSSCEDSSTNPINIPTYDKEDRAYFPLRSGNTWNYAIVEEGDTASYYDYIVGEVTGDSNDLRAVLRYQNTSHTVEEYARWVRNEFRVSSEHQYEVELLWLKVPLTVGKSWEMYNYTNENLVWESYAEVIGDSVPVSTVAGDFYAVEIKEIITQHETDAPVLQDSIFHYYVKDIGKVKSIESSEVHELRFYNVQPEE